MSEDLRVSSSLSPSMVACSLALHVVLIVTVAMWRTNTQPVRPVEKPVKVKLVESAPGPPSMERLTAGHEDKPAELMPEPVQEAAQPQPPVPSIAIESVAAKAVDPGESLKTVKRRRQPKKAEEPAVEQAAKPAQEKPKKKEDSEALLQSRMEALRREVENRKTDSAQPKAQAQGRGGSGESDEKINRWFRDVKQRINAKWSLPADLPGGHRTIIGVQITESGAIATAGVDESSGDPVFDRSAMRAVVQAAPFPPAPMELRERIREAGGLAFRFTPKGLQ